MVLRPLCGLNLGSGALCTSSTAAVGDAMFLQKDIWVIKKVFGVAVAIATYVVVATAIDQLILPLPTSGSHWPYLWALGGFSALSYLFAMAAGSWAAQGRFYLISVLLWATPWVVMVPWLYKMQQAASPMGRLEFIITQLPFIVPSLAATLLGSWLGTWLSSRRGQTPDSWSKLTAPRGAG